MAFTTQHDETMSKKQSTCQDKNSQGLFSDNNYDKNLSTSYQLQIDAYNTRNDQFNLVEEVIYITLLVLQLNIRLNREIRVV